MLEVRIGIVESSKEVALEVDENPSDFIKKVEKALNGEKAMLWITDRKGRQVGIQAHRLAYLEIDPESPVRSVGFAP